MHLSDAKIQQHARCEHVNDIRIHRHSTPGFTVKATQSGNSEQGQHEPVGLTLPTNSSACASIRDVSRSPERTCADGLRLRRSR